MKIPSQSSSVCRTLIIGSLLLLGCADSGDDGAGEVMVLCAASAEEPMRVAVTTGGNDDSSQVSVATGPSSGLAAQILAGAPADLFLSANRDWADAVIAATPLAEHVTLLSNRLVLIVPKAAALPIQEPADLLQADIRHIAIAAEQVPAGMYAVAALKSHELWDKLKTANKFVPGHDVRSTLSYVERGEADAGIVYATDAMSSTAVRVAYTFNADTHPEIEYVLVLLNDRPEARRVFETIQSRAGLRPFLDAGFTVPTPHGEEGDE